MSYTISVLSSEKQIIAPQTLKVKNLEHLGNLITDNTCSSALTVWSPMVFKPGTTRASKNFDHTSFMVFDFDSGYTLEEAKIEFAGVKHIIATTRNHQREKHGLVCDRFRVICPLDKPISNPTEYQKIWDFYSNSISGLFPHNDQQTKDLARIYFRSIDLISIIDDESTPCLNQHSQFLEREATESYTVYHTKLKSLRLSQSTISFMLYGAPQGKFNKSLCSAAFEFARKGIPEDTLISLWNQNCRIPQFWAFDDNDLGAIASTYRSVSASQASGALLDPSMSIYNTVWNWIEKHPVYRSDYAGVVNSTTNEQVSPTTLRNMCWRDLTTNPQTSHLNPSDNEIEKTLHLWREDKKETYLQSMKKEIAYSNTVSALKVDVALSTMFALGGSMNIELDKSILYTLIWNIKNKIINKRVSPMPLFCVFYGPQGAGKTYLVRKLLEPIKRLSTVTDFTSVQDERRYRDFGTYAVLFLDEMGKIDRADTEMVKNKITSEKVSGRALYTNATDDIFNLATLIGCSNKPLSEIYQDTTGVRRFWEFNIHPDRGTTVGQPFKRFQDAVNQVPWNDLWKCVDENGPIPLSGEHKDVMHNIQETEIKAKATEEQFLEDMGYVFTLDKDRMESIANVYGKYTVWCDQNGFKPTNANNFSIRVRGILKIQCVYSDLFKFEESKKAQKIGGVLIRKLPLMSIKEEK